MFHITLDCNGRPLELDRPRIAGIVNVTPDSFSDGGQFADAAAAIAHGVKLVEEGADLLDVGGESTRPGAEPVDATAEIARVVPVIEGLAKATRVPISIDTSKPEVMRAAVAVGAGLVNDVRALREDGALDAAAALGVPVILAHMLGDPRTMQDDPQYDDVVGDVHRFLTERLFACQMAGIDKKKILVDPGFGFGKTLEHNLLLLRDLKRFAEIGPVCRRTVAQRDDRQADRTRSARRSCGRLRGGGADRGAERRINRARARCCDHARCARRVGWRRRAW